MWYLYSNVLFFIGSVKVGILGKSWNSGSVKVGIGSVKVGIGSVKVGIRVKKAFIYQQFSTSTSIYKYNKYIQVYLSNKVNPEYEMVQKEIMTDR